MNQQSMRFQTESSLSTRCGEREREADRERHEEREARRERQTESGTEREGGGERERHGERERAQAPLMEFQERVIRERKRGSRESERNKKQNNNGENTVTAVLITLQLYHRS